MREGAELFDIQSEMELSGEIHHIASASGLKHKIYLVPRGPIAKVTRTKILDILNNKEIKQNILPVISVPSSEGFFSHKGDSFREIVDMWAERGYITKEVGNSSNVWYDGVGNVLLYDRPNYDWIKQADSKEQSWKIALFGNPKPIGPNSKSWTFWARRPRLVEAMLDTKFEKTRGLVFYGKIENQVQRANRTKHDWASCCEKFFMGSETEPPIFSEQKYLDNLSKAKYGLCLAGYGKKCHREVECMALGTVPVCAPEVDMDNYANPPVENIHFLRVENPEDAKEKLAKVSDEKWLEMSEACKQWYKENCSVDGMWKLTQKLIS